MKKKPNRFARLVVVTSCTALIGTFGYAPSASSHIGSSHSQVVTDWLDLVSATLNATTGDVKACFDGAVAAIGAVTSAFLGGYDSAKFDNAASMALDADPMCVNLNYSAAPANQERAQATYLEAVGPGTGAAALVTGTSGEPNSTGAVQLDGGVAEAARDHVDPLEVQTVTPEAGGGSATFAFEKTLDGDVAAGDLEAMDFGYQDQTGTIFRGDGALTAGPPDFSGSSVEVPFTSPADDTSMARRFFVDTIHAGAPGCVAATEEAVWDRGTAPTPAGVNLNAKFNAPGTILVGAGATAFPDPNAAVEAPPNAIDATFDEGPITTVNPGCVIGIEKDGGTHIATAGAVLNPGASGTQVRYTFGAGATAVPTSELQIFALRPGAAINAAGESNTYGSFELSSGLPSGFSDGSDLEQASKDTANDRVTYCGDVEDNLGTATPVVASHYIQDATGTTTTFGTGLVGVSANCRTIQFPANSTAGGVAAGAVFGAVGDTLPAEATGNLNTVAGSPATLATDNPNVSPTAAVQIGGPPPTPPGPPAPPGPPTPPPPPPGPGVNKFATSLTIKHQSPFNGKAKSALDACEGKRKVTLYAKAPKDKIGKDKTNAKGKWKVGKRHDHPDRFFAKVKKKKLADGTVCKGDKSRTISA